MTNLERIEDYYNHVLSDEERAAFEAELKSNAALAEEVAFYVQVRAVAQAEARARRLQEFNALGTQTARAQSRNFAYIWAAAASVVLLLGFGAYWWFFAASSSPETATNEWATQYIENNFTTLSGTTMGNGTDSLQLGLRLYNSGRYGEAQRVFDMLLQRDSSDVEAEKLAGIVSLRRGQYDQAIEHFHRLGKRTDLVSNPGKFYEALALLKKNVPLDNYKAKKLLEEVKEGKLEGWKEVEEKIN